MLQLFRLSSLAFLAALVSAAPAVVLVDRGLPNQHLNDPVFSNRSNVAVGASGGWFTGDDFKLPTAAPAYSINGIRTWLVTNDNYNASPQKDFSELISSLTLWLGPAGASNDVTATSYPFTATRVTYDGSTTYDGLGSMYSLWQIDWDTAGLVLAGGSKYNFGVSGLRTDGSTRIFNHASNAGLGGVPSDGADNLIILFQTDGAFGRFDDVGDGTFSSMDINVVVTGVPVPEPATIALGLGGLAAAALRRRARR